VRPFGLVFRHSRSTAMVSGRLKTPNGVKFLLRFKRYAVTSQQPLTHLICHFLPRHVLFTCYGSGSATWLYKMMKRNEWTGSIIKSSTVRSTSRRSVKIDWSTDQPIRVLLEIRNSGGGINSNHDFSNKSHFNPPLVTFTNFHRPATIPDWFCQVELYFWYFYGNRLRISIRFGFGSLDRRMNVQSRNYRKPLIKVIDNDDYYSPLK